MNNKERIDLAQWIIDQARKDGATDVAVALANTREFDLTYRNQEIEKLQETIENDLTLNIYINHKFSSHSTNDIRKDSLKKFITEAVASTKYLTEDPYRCLPDPKYYPKDLSTNLVLVDPQYSKIETGKKIEIVKEIEQAALAKSEKIISVGTEYSDYHSEGVQVHSNGFIGEREGTSFDASAEVSVRGEGSSRPEDYSMVSSRFYLELESPKFVGEDAAKRALQKINQAKLNSGKYDMIVENRAASRLLGLFMGPLSGRALQQKSSFLEGMLDKKIASEKLTITDNPFVPKGHGSRLFDGDGMATQKRTIIENGVLRTYFIDHYYSQKLGVPPTTGGPSNLIFSTGDLSLTEMIKQVKRGILITNFIGGNSNSTTGDFSFGIMGLLIENGELIKPVNEMNISGNSKTFWHQLVEMGNDPYPYSSWYRPSLLFEGVDFSGI